MSSYKCLEIRQKAAIRIVTSSPYNSHTEPLFKLANILPLSMLIKFLRLQFFQRYKQGFMPAALLNQWTTNFNRNPSMQCLNLRNQEDYFVPSSRLTQFDNFPFYAIPKIWNNFENHNIKILREKQEFNYKLKKYFTDSLKDNYVCNPLLCPFCHLT